MKVIQKHVSMQRGASALVLSGELTEGVSDLSMAQTATGGVPALREVNQDRSHPDAPLIEEQAHTDYRRLVNGGGNPVTGSWTTVSPPGRNTHGQPPGPAQKAYNAQVEQSQQRAERDRPVTGSRTQGGQRNG